jgi:hypothetical protein
MVGEPGPTTGTSAYQVNPVGIFSTISGPIHFTGDNWLYADGHVKYLDFSNSDLTVNSVVHYTWLRNKG